MKAGSPAPARIAALDGLRAFAILLVMAVHYYSIVPTPDGSTVNDILRRATSLGYSGVDLFFVLSGFLIGGIILDHRTSPRLLPVFYTRRFFRIVPLYLLLLTSFFIARAIPSLRTVNHGTYFDSPVPLWSYFLFVQNVAMTWMRDFGPYWLGATWSLAVEEQFYLITPLLLRRAGLRAITWGCVVVILVSPWLRMNALYQANNPVAAIFLLLTHADGLVWGVLCACLVRMEAARAAVRQHGMVLGLIIIVGAVVFGFASMRNYGADSPQMITWGYSLLSIWFAAMVLGVIVFPEHRACQWLSWRPLTMIGITSYFIYLFHTPIWYVLHWAIFRLPPLHVRWQAGAVTLLAVGVTFVAARVSWRWFEGPLLRRGRRQSYE